MRNSNRHIVEIKDDEVLISVVMSVFRTPERFLRASIKSILNQSFKKFEFIIVVDGDTNSFNFISEYNDPRIRILFNKTNRGLSYSLNLAISVSIGKYIFRMDSDDISFVDRLSKQFRLLENGKELLTSRCVSIDADGNIIGESKRYILHNIVRRIQMYHLKFNPVIHPSVAGKREIFINNPYDENILYGQDMELWFRISKHFKFFFMSEALLFYRQIEMDPSKKTYQNNVDLAIRKRKI